MEIGPIVRALFHSRSRFLLIALEIALTLAVVANCLNMIGDQRRQMLRQTGLDEANLLVVTSSPFAAAFEDRNYVRTSYEEDLRAMRAMPGVHAATGLTAIPLSGGGSATGRRPAGSEVQTQTTPYFAVGTQALETLGVELIAGRDFVADDYPTPPDPAQPPSPSGGAAGAAATPEVPRNVIVTQALADALFPDGNALGQRIEGSKGNSPETIVGIVRQMHGSWPLSPVAERVELVPGEPFDARQVLYMVRTEPGAIDELHKTLEEKLLATEPGRIIEIKTLAEVKYETYRDLSATNQLLGGVSVLLVLVTGLGIVGLTAFSVTQRRRQIGTRRALGATRLHILRYFLVENWLVTSFGLAAGLLLTYALNFALARFADVPRIEFSLVATGVALLWVVGLLAALAPALRGTAVSPVVATRSV